jgi:SAM-dependent methyltransferase
VSFDVVGYWEARYAHGKRGSGDGSRGDAAKRKAAFINSLIAERNVSSVTDWGCGDGVVARLIEAPAYVGLDVSPSAIALCRVRADAPGRTWLAYDGLTAPELPPADLALSLDVIFHLTDDALYRRHLELLFGSAPLVCIHSSNREEADEVTHMRSREFVPDVPHGWRCIHEGPGDAIGFWVFEHEATS